MAERVGPRTVRPPRDFVSLAEPPVTWSPDARQEPAEVAAAHVQARLVEQLRERGAHDAAGVAATSGVPYSAVLEIVSGRRAVSLADVCRIALAYGLRPFPEEGSDDHGWFPSPYAPLLRQWAPGDGPPRFFAPGPSGLLLAAASELASGVLDPRLVRLLSPASLAHQTAAALVRLGVPDHAVTLEPVGPELRVRTASWAAVVRFTAAFGDEPDPAAWAALVRSAAAAPEQVRGVLTVAAEPAALRLLDLVGAEPDEPNPVVVLPGHVLAGPDGLGDDVRGACVIYTLPRAERLIVFECK